MTLVTCPNCQQPNRPGARFCSRCQAALSSSPPAHAVAPPSSSQPARRQAAQATQKVCPVCSTANRMDAGYCKTCGRTFSQSGGTNRGREKRWSWFVAAAALLGVVVVLVGLLLSGSSGRDDATVTPTSVAAFDLPIATTALTATIPPLPLSEPTPVAVDDPLDRSLLATVQVLVPVDGVRDQWSTGSGSVITHQGHVLTNYHVLGDPDTGQLFNRDGVVYIAVSSADVRSEPEIAYRAEILEIDRTGDLALLKIMAQRDGRPLPAGFRMVSMPLGDSDTVRIGDELTILGYPGLGGQSITLTRGSVSGFLSAEDFIKTDAEINPGNSGGAAVNRAGELVGVPTAGAFDEEFPGKLGLVRPINQARPLIDRALREAGELH